MLQLRFFGFAEFVLSAYEGVFVYFLSDEGFALVLHYVFEVGWVAGFVVQLLAY